MSRRSVKSAVHDRLVALPLWLAVLLPVLTWLALAQGLPRLGHGLAVKMGVMLAPAWAAIVAVICLCGWAFGVRQRMLMREVDSLEALRALDWKQLERMVGALYRALGYSVSESWKGGADGGVDLDVRRGAEHMVVQCKQWRTRRVPVEKARELWGIVASEEASGGILVTCGTFTPDAEAFARGKNLQLVDGAALLALLKQSRTDVGPAADATMRGPAEVAAGPDATARAKVAAPEATAHGPAGVAAASDAGSSCPRCGGPMVRRTARKGARVGTSFWGCSAYPRCRGTRDPI